MEKAQWIIERVIVLFRAEDFLFIDVPKFDCPVGININQIKTWLQNNHVLYDTEWGWDSIL